MRPDNRATEEMLEEMDAENRNTMDDVASGDVWPICEDADGYSPPRDGPDAHCERQPLIYYVMDLEALVKWFALMFSYRVYDTETGEETLVQNDPIWTTYDERGTHLAAAERLQATWNKVMHDD